MGLGLSQAAGAAAFEQLRGLIGEWRGTRPDGRPVCVSYRLSACDSVLVETWNFGPGREALTVYHLDGGELMATHFCPQGNQPRLRMRRAEGSRFEFTFQDATGVAPGQSVQNEFWIEIGANGTFARGETYLQDDEAESETITYARLGG